MVSFVTHELDACLILINVNHLLVTFGLVFVFANYLLGYGKE